MTLKFTWPSPSYSTNFHEAYLGIAQVWTLFQLDPRSETVVQSVLSLLNTMSRLGRLIPPGARGILDVHHSAV